MGVEHMHSKCRTVHGECGRVFDVALHDLKDPDW